MRNDVKQTIQFKLFIVKHELVNGWTHARFTPQTIAKWLGQLFKCSIINTLSVSVSFSVLVSTHYFGCIVIVCSWLVLYGTHSQPHRRSTFQLCTQLKFVIFNNDVIGYFDFWFLLVAALFQQCVVDHHFFAGLLFCFFLFSFGC